MLTMLLGLLGTKGKLGLDLIVGCIIVFLSLSVWFFKHEADKNLADAVQAQTAYNSTIEAVQSYAQELVRRNDQIDELDSIYDQLRNKADEQMQVFAKHNIQSDAKIHPGMVLKRINTATAGMFNSLEASSTFTENPAGGKAQTSATGTSASPPSQVGGGN